MEPFYFDGAKTLELFSCYESILPPGHKLGPTVGMLYEYEYEYKYTCQYTAIMKYSNYVY